jgi:hypothetical protein
LIVVVTLDAAILTIANPFVGTYLGRIAALLLVLPDVFHFTPVKKLSNFRTIDMVG